MTSHISTNIYHQSVSLKSPDWYTGQLFEGVMNTLVLLNQWRGQTGSIERGLRWGWGVNREVVQVLLRQEFSHWRLYSRQQFNHFTEVDLLSCLENSWEGIRRWECWVRFRVVEWLTEQQSNCCKWHLSSGLYKIPSSETPNQIYDKQTIPLSPMVRVQARKHPKILIYRTTKMPLYADSFCLDLNLK